MYTERFQVCQHEVWQMRLEISKLCSPARGSAVILGMIVSLGLGPCRSNHTRGRCVLPAAMDRFEGVVSEVVDHAVRTLRVELMGVVVQPGMQAAIVGVEHAEM